MLFFNRENQYRKLLGYLPKGRIFKQARKKGTNFNNIILWISKSFERLLDKFNIYFKGLYICESKIFIEDFKRDFSIPNEVFYQADNDEHYSDILVLKYLMRGNKKQNFKLIAQLYGYCAVVETGDDFFQKSRLPNRVPHRLNDYFANSNTTLVVILYKKVSEGLPYKIPHRLSADLKVGKIKKIFDLIKPAHIKIIYLEADYEVQVTEYLDIIPSEIPHLLGNIIKTENVFVSQDCEELKICNKG